MGDLALLLNSWHTSLQDTSLIKTELEALIESDLKFSIQGFTQLANDAIEHLPSFDFHPARKLKILVQNSIWDIYAIRNDDVKPKHTGTGHQGHNLS